MLCPNWGSRSISRPRLFNPTALDPEQWVLAAKALGVQEICLTAQHEGGFALWPSNWTNYSVASSPWMDGKGDVLRQFAVRSSFLSLGKLALFLSPKHAIGTLDRVCERALGLLGS